MIKILPIKQLDCARSQNSHIYKVEYFYVPDIIFKNTCFFQMARKIPSLSQYYIPGRTTEASRTSFDTQDISGFNNFEDNDGGTEGIEEDLHSDVGQREPSDSFQYYDEQSAVRDDSSDLEQEGFGLFFIGEHESFSGSEEHFSSVPLESLFIPPNRNKDMETFDNPLVSKFNVVFDDIGIY